SHSSCTAAESPSCNGPSQRVTEPSDDMSRPSRQNEVEKVPAILRTPSAQRNRPSRVGDIEDPPGGGVSRVRHCQDVLPLGICPLTWIRGQNGPLGKASFVGVPAGAVLGIPLSPGRRDNGEMILAAAVRPCLARGPGGFIGLNRSPGAAKRGPRSRQV